MTRVMLDDYDRSLVYAIGFQRWKKALNYRSDGNTDHALWKDEAGVAGEVALLSFLDVGVGFWNALWNYELPDVDIYDVKTSTVPKERRALWVQDAKIRANLDQIYVLAWTDNREQYVDLVGWTRASDIVEHGIYNVEKRLWKMPEQELAPMDELTSA